MTQTRKQSLCEAGSNTAIAAGVNLSASVVVYPWFGAHFSMAQNVGLVAVFTVISIVRNYFTRRWFNSKVK